MLNSVGRRPGSDDGLLVANFEKRPGSAVRPAGPICSESKLSHELGAACGARAHRCIGSAERETARRHDHSGVALRG